MNITMNRELVSVLAECAAACNYCAVSCLQEDDVKMMERCIRLDLDCAAICKMALDYVSRDSTMKRDVLDLCARVCRECGAECEKHSHMEHCRMCAEACRRCEQACQQA
ncbi:four-helix bundle copper-binding protein [Pontibacter sp. FD36]|uniref:Four-helix bundle copper-binding protein n=3 Tax=Hymenobacteraceae TaxID=1853232 RepID=A0A2U1B4Z7_9BACT|nr:four-helix bundle copper-binding protein [Pontibacter sp. FD36]PVY43718.1 hypothetical protein C8E01_10174 [Pontibacter virosus]GGG18384.1 ferredoxin [Pontibacter amylolyticus]